MFYNLENFFSKAKGETDKTVITCLGRIINVLVNRYPCFLKQLSTPSVKSSLTQETTWRQKTSCNRDVRIWHDILDNIDLTRGPIH